MPEKKNTTKITYTVFPDPKSPDELHFTRKIADSNGNTIFVLPEVGQYGLNGPLKIIYQPAGNEAGCTLTSVMHDAILKALVKTGQKKTSGNVEITTYDSTDPNLLVGLCQKKPPNPAPSLRR